MYGEVKEIEMESNYIYYNCGSALGHDRHICEQTIRLRSEFNANYFSPRGGCGGNATDIYFFGRKKKSAHPLEGSMDFCRNRGHQLCIF